MTSKQVLLSLGRWSLLALLLVLLEVASGCGTMSSWRGAESPEIPAAYAERRVLAVAPFRNESGTVAADGVRMAEHLAAQLESAPNVDVLPVSRSLAAMDALALADVRTLEQAMALLGVLEADGLVVGTISSYDPYDPPRLGVAAELFVNRRLLDRTPPADVREMVRRAVPTQTSDRPGLPATSRAGQPVSGVSGHFLGSDPDVRAALERYAARRDRDRRDTAWRSYLLSMDLFSEFVNFELARRLMQAEHRRLQPPTSTANRMR